MFQNIRRIRHAKTKHATLRNDFNQLPEKLRKRSANVATVSSCVFGSQPDLANAFLERLDGSGDDLLGWITPQLASSVFRFAVGALIQAAGVDWDNFNEWVLADFR